MSRGGGGVTFGEGVTLGRGDFGGADIFVG